MRSINNWLNWEKNTKTLSKSLMANISVKIRNSQFKKFKEINRPNSNSKILDVGVTSDETFKDSNLFEKLYRWPEKLTVVTIESSKKLKRMYPKIKIVKIIPSEKLPFRTKSFDVVVSWATLEHVGGYKKQQDFLNELLRVGKKIFLTTPDRSAIYEPHTGFLFLHWIPLKWFRAICRLFNITFWSKEENLNPLWLSDIQRMKLTRCVKVEKNKLFNLFSSHIIITI